MPRAQSTQVVLSEQLLGESEDAGSYSDALGVAQDAQEGLEEAGEGLAVAGGCVCGEQAQRSAGRPPGLPV